MPVDTLRVMGLPCALYAITITGGHEVTRPEDKPLDLHIPKKDLVGALQVLLSGRRLRISKELALASVLEKELANFRVKVTASANETYEAWREGDRDDLVLATAIACWLGERFPPYVPGSVSSGKSWVPTW